MAVDDTPVSEAYALEPPVVSDEKLIARVAEAGITIRREWCATCLPTWAAGYETGRQLLEKQPDLTAIVCGNDLVALGVMRAAVEAGSVTETVELEGRIEGKNPELLGGMTGVARFKDQP